MKIRAALPAMVLPLIPLLACTGCGSQEETIGGSGMLEADQTVVSSETSGRVDELRFNEGSLVQLGDTLLVIDPSRHDLELAAALAGQEVVQARLRTERLQILQALETERFLKNEQDRVTMLAQSGTAAQRQLDQVEHECRSAILARQRAEAGIGATEAELRKVEADIDRIKRQLQDCYPAAPISGMVTDRFVDLGELLVPGKPMVKVSRLDTMWVKIYLPTGDFAQVTVGDQAVVDTEAGQRRYRGQVVWTSEEAEFTPKNVQTRKSRANLLYAVKVRVPNDDGRLKIGMPVFVTIEK